MLKTIIETERQISECPVALQAKFDAKKAGDLAARHGDLNLIKAAAIPSGAKRIESKILLKSDATGHLHGVRGKVSVFEAESQNKEFGTVRYLQVEGPAVMGMHLEHEDRSLPVGVIEVRPMREGRSDAWRRVMD